MKKLLSLIACVFIISSVYPQDKSAGYDKLLRDVDKELKELMEVMKAPGFAVAVVNKDTIIYMKGFGYRDYEKKIPVTPNTLFAIGSCSKAFTTSILGQLRKEGKLNFDDKPGKYIPGFSFVNDEMNNTINIKDMITHRTGLPRHDYAWFLFTSDSKDSLIHKIAYQEPFAGVREAWYYNNFMYLAQGVISEKITGNTWEENVSNRLFSPLKMFNSNLDIDGLKNSDNAAFGYELYQDSIIKKMDYYDIAGMSPAGSVNSNVHDMSNWLLMWINGGKFKGEEILPPEYIIEAMSPQMIINSALPSKELPDVQFATYGYGWMMSSYKGHYRVEHGGNINGFSANTCFFPMDSIGIVVLANQNGSGVPSGVCNILADRLLELNRTDWVEKTKESLAKAKEAMVKSVVKDVTPQIQGTKPSHPLKDYTGNYSNPGYGSFDLILKHDSLFIQLPPKKFWLRHYHYDVFEPLEMKETGIDTTNIGGLRVNFTTNNSGEISNLNINFEQIIDPIEFTHEPAPVDIEAKDLEKYSGDYELAGVITKFYTKEDNVLYLFVAGQPEYELIARGDNKFSFKTLDGFSVQFVEGEDGLIKEVLFIQPNGTFKAIRK